MIAVTLFPLLPREASSVAPHVDKLVLVLCCIAGIMALAVFVGIAYLAIRYRNGSTADRHDRIVNSTPVEIGWTGATLVIFLGFFASGLGVYYRDFRPDPSAMDIYVVGKQWMWKVEHPDGRREINELHVPVGQEIRLMLISQDVIHDFFVPAFRVKRDVLPGRYETMSVRPTVPGIYHLFCSQFCGAFHAKMAGSVYVMDGPGYQRWLAAVPAPEPMAREGAALFRRYGCVACHQPGGRGPQLAGLPGRLVHLSDGTVVVADDDYIRNSILASTTQVVAGYQPIMPIFQGQLTETQVNALIAYIKSLGIEEQEKTQP